MKIEKMFSNISVFYENTATEMRRKILAMLLGSNACFMDNEFVNLLSDVRSMVFGRAGVASRSEYEKLWISKHDLLQERAYEDRYFYNEIKKIHPNLLEQFGSTLSFRFPLITTFLKELAILIKEP